MSRERATSEPRTLMTYSCESSAMSSWMRTGEMTIPSSPAIWRRTTPTRASSDPPAALSASGTRPKPIASSSGSIASAPTAASLGEGSCGWGVSRSSWSASAASARVGLPLSMCATSMNEPPTMRNGIFGRPGTSAMQQIAPPATSGALRWSRIWVAMSLPRSFSDVERVTMMPVATEISSAGICAARPSPTVSSEKWAAASENGIPCCIVPTMIPPTRLMMTMRTAAIASPLTNFEAPSIAP